MRVFEKIKGEFVETKKEVHYCVANVRELILSIDTHYVMWQQSCEFTTKNNKITSVVIFDVFGRVYKITDLYWTLQDQVLDDDRHEAEQMNLKDGLHFSELHSEMGEDRDYYRMNFNTIA